MCLAVPMKLIARQGSSGVVELEGVRRSVSLALMPEARTGDHLLIHAGYAIGAVDEKEAAETIRLLHEMAEAESREGSGRTRQSPEGNQA
jgi:hydrogenase expression/formation protein HypC